MVNEIVVESNNTITLEQFDYFRESTYRSVTQLVVEAEIDIVLNEGKFTDAVKAIFNKITELIQKFIEWVVGIIKKIKNAIFGRKKNLEKIKRDINAQAKEAGKQGTSGNSKIDIDYYSMKLKNDLQKYFEELNKMAEHINTVDDADYFTKYDENDDYYANNKLPEKLTKKKETLDDLHYDFNIEDGIHVDRTSVSDTADAANSFIDWIDGQNSNNQKIIQPMQRYVDNFKKVSRFINTADHKDATDEQKKNLIKVANLLFDIENALIKKCTEYIQFNQKLSDTIYDKNMKELEKFSVMI